MWHINGNINNESCASLHCTHNSSLMPYCNWCITNPTHTTHMYSNEKLNGTVQRTSRLGRLLSSTNCDDKRIEMRFLSNSNVKILKKCNNNTLYYSQYHFNFHLAILSINIQHWNGIENCLYNMAQFCVLSLSNWSQSLVSARKLNRSDFPIKWKMAFFPFKRPIEFDAWMEKYRSLLLQIVHCTFHINDIII